MESYVINLGDGDVTIKSMKDVLNLANDYWTSVEEVMDMIGLAPEEEHETAYASYDEGYGEYEVHGAEAYEVTYICYYAFGECLYRDTECENWQITIEKNA